MPIALAALTTALACPPGTVEVTDEEPVVRAMFSRYGSVWCRRPDGVAHGPATEVADGATWEGEYVDGRRWGVWTISGRLTEQGEVVDGERDGYWEGRPRGDRLRYTGHYCDGTPCGHWAWYDDDGTLTSVIDLAPGQVVRWDTDGEIIEVGQTRDGERVGLWGRRLDWCVDRERRHGWLWGEYAGGQPHGWWVQRGPDRELLGATLMLDGTGTVTEWHASGAKRCEGELVGGEREGSWACWDVAGRTSEITTYRHGQRDGARTTFDQDGDPLEQWTYVEGEREGAYQRWSWRGFAVEAGRYVDDRKEGVWTHRNRRGAVSAEVTWRRGIRHGPFRVFTLEGELEREGHYAHGRVVAR